MKAELRLKDLGIFKTGLTYSPDNLCEPNEGVLVLRSANIQNDKIDLNDCAYVNNKIDSNMYVRKGDILICSRNGSANLVGKTAIIEKDMNATWGAFMMLLRTRYNSNYINYLLNATIRKEKGRFATSTINQLTNSMLGGIHVDIFTEIVEQQKIVDYLDEKTSAIDTQVELLEKKKDAYTRLKKAMINRAVTRGLDEHVKLKDSGVEWIGMIPEHWVSLHLKNFVTINNGSDYKHIEAEEGIPVIGSGGIFAHATEKMYDGEVLLLGRKGTIDRPMYYKGAFWAVDTMFYAIPMKNVSAKYLYYCATQFPFNKISTATALPSMTQTDLYQLPVVMPPYEEQQSIAAYLDEKCAKIDAAIANIDKQTDALKRLKRSLINEVISGKRMIE